MTPAYTHLHSGSQFAGLFNTAWKLPEKPHLLLHCISWQMIEDHVPLRSAIQISIILFHLYQASLNKTWFIMDISFQSRCASGQQFSHHSVYTKFIVHLILLCSSVSACFLQHWISGSTELRWFRGRRGLSRARLCYYFNVRFICTWMPPQECLCQ